jgi:phage-related protein
MISALTQCFISSNLHGYNLAYILSDFTKKEEKKINLDKFINRHASKNFTWTILIYA